MVISGEYPDAAVTIDHSGSFQITALNAPIFHVEYDHTGGHETSLNNFLVASNAKPDEIYED
jgi:hypothetical protein